MHRIVFFIFLALPISANAEGISWAIGGPGIDGLYDPHAWTTRTEIEVGSQIFEPLILNGSGTSYTPVLAETVTFDEPGLALITLREGVVFHDGQRLDAEDVVYSILRSQGADSTLNSLTSSVLDISLIDQRTVSVTFSGEISQFLYMLSRVMIIDSEDEGYFETEYRTSHFNGTGAFRVESYEPGLRLYLTQFDGYREALEHEVTAAEVVFIPNPETAAAALAFGGVNIWTGASFDVVERLQRQGIAELVLTPSDYFYVAELPFAATGTASSLRPDDAQALITGSLNELDITDTWFRSVDYGASTSTGPTLTEGTSGFPDSMGIFCQVDNGELGKFCRAVEQQLAELGIRHQTSTDWYSSESSDLHLRWRRLQDLVFPETEVNANSQGSIMSIPLAVGYRITAMGDDETIPLGQTGFPLLSPYADSDEDDGCGSCPPSGACSQTIIQARQECCPPSGACGQ